jgi:ribosomal protein L11 methyltransferase
MSPSAAKTSVARLRADEATAREISGTLGELLDAAGTAVAAFEAEDGAWLVEIYNDAALDEEALRAVVRQAAGDAAAARLQFAALPERDWVASSLAGLKPVRAGRFVLHGAHDRGSVPSHRIGIEIEAALAFGTGHHGTTRGCLLAFELLVKKRRSGRTRVLDVGTGTGVLAIAAARALRCPVTASDIDCVAVRIAKTNARHNRASTYIRTVRAAGATAYAITRRGPYSIVFANILLGPLKRLARPIGRVIRQGSVVIVSGLLPVQANAARAAYAMQGLRLEQRIELEGWTTLVLRRPRRPRMTGASG